MYMYSGWRSSYQERTRIGWVMASVLASHAADCEIKRMSGQTKVYKI